MKFQTLVNSKRFKILRRINVILIFNLIFILSLGRAEDFNLHGETFDLGSWNEKEITVAQARQKIEKLDEWYSKLDYEDENKFRRDYTLNRNRLYIVAQKKLMTEEIVNLSSMSTRVGGLLDLGYTKEGLRDLRQDLNKRREFFSDLWNAAKMDESKISEDVYYDYGSFRSGAIKNPGEKNGPSFLSQTFSKSSGARDPMLMSQMSGDLSLFGGNLRNIEDLKKILERLKKDQKKRMSCDENLRPRSSAQKEKFLKELGFKPSEATSTHRDLSSYYSSPQTQWKENAPGARCVGYAIASDMEVELNRKKWFPLRNSKVSAEHTYVIGKEVEAGHLSELKSKGKDYCNPETYEVEEDGLLLPETLEAIRTQPVCAGEQKFNISGYQFLERQDKQDNPFDYDLLRTLIDNKMPPVVMVDTDSRKESGNWITLTSRGRYNHALNVVGYGTDYDPESLCKVHYFIIRDSLGKKLIHYKVRAENLLEHLVGVYKVTGVEERKSSSSTSSSPHAGGQ